MDNDVDPPTTLKFQGRLDYPKDILSAQDGQILEIEGRHTSFALTEIFVSGQFVGQTAASIISSLVTTFLTGLGFTSTNVQTFGSNVTISWDEKPFWECLADLAILVGADFYIDDDKDIHFFPENSVRNDIDAFVEPYTLRVLKNFGQDSYYIKTQVRVYGQDDQGVPIIATAGVGGTREIVVTDTSITTYAEASARAQAELDRLSQDNLPPQATAIGKMMFGLDPGENFWISTPRQKIIGLFKAISIKHKFGARTPYETEVIVEKETKGTEQLMRDRAKKELTLRSTTNLNRMKYSYNFVFDDDSNIETQDGTSITGGALVTPLTGTGVMVSTTRVTAANVTQIELRVAGTDLNSSRFEASANDGVNYFVVTPNQVLNVPDYGQSNRLKLKVSLVNDTTNPSPKLDSVALLYQ